MCVNSSQAEVIIEPLGFNEQRWIAPTNAVGVKISGAPDMPMGRLAFFIGKHDVSALVRPVAPGEYQYIADVLPLPSGEQDFAVFYIDQENQWKELGSLSIKVLSPYGLEASDMQPRFDVIEKSLIYTDTDEEGVEIDPNRNHALSMQGGLSTTHKRNGLELRSEWNIVGSTVQEEAIRFYTEGDDAPKVDLSDYLVELETDSGTLSLGHVNFEGNSLLAGSIQNRGAKGSYSLTDWSDISFTAQGGREVVGYSNITGLGDYSDNRAVAINLGLNLLGNSAHRLRLDLSYLVAKITSEPTFDFEEVTDAERSRGFALSLSGSDENDRLRGNFSLARSTYTNPLDPFLAQDLDVLESESTTDTAYAMNMAWNLIKSYQVTEDLPLSVTLGWRHSRTDPLFNSVASDINPDLKTTGITIEAQIGYIDLLMRTERNRDNLDDIETILTTETTVDAIMLNVPIHSVFNSSAQLIPESLGFSYEDNQQTGKNTPVGFDPESHIPDQVTTTLGVTLNWLLGEGGFSYQYSVTDQDNRQLGRQNADFKDTENSIALDYPISDALNTSFTLSQIVAEDIEQKLDRSTYSLTVNLDWLITTKWSLATNFDFSESSDSENIAESKALTAQVQTAYTFNVSASGKKMPGQFFVRYSEDRLEDIDNEFDLESSRRIWAINAGINITLF